MPEAEVPQTLPNKLTPAAREQTIPTATFLTYQDHEKARRKRRKGRRRRVSLLGWLSGLGLSDTQEGGSLSRKEGRSCRQLVAYHAREEMGAK